MWRLPHLIYKRKRKGAGIKRETHPAKKKLLGVGKEYDLHRKMFQAPEQSEERRAILITEKATDNLTESNGFNEGGEAFRMLSGS